MNEDAPIYWERDYRLQVKDFGKDPPKEPKIIDDIFQESAESGVGINWILGKTDLSVREGKKYVEFLEVGIDAMFDKHNSWIVVKNKTPDKI